MHQQGSQGFGKMKIKDFKGPFKGPLDDFKGPCGNIFAWWLSDYLKIFGALENSLDNFLESARQTEMLQS